MHFRYSVNFLPNMHLLNVDLEPVGESKALKTYCCRMVSVVHRHKHPAASRHPEKKKSRRDRSDTRHRELRLEREESCLPELTVGKRRDVNSQLPLLDPVDRPVPMQLISVLKLKSFAEEMRRVRKGRMTINPQMVHTQLSNRVIAALYRIKTNMDTNGFLFVRWC